MSIRSPLSITVLLALVACSEHRSGAVAERAPDGPRPPAVSGDGTVLAPPLIPGGGGSSTGAPSTPPTSTVEPGAATTGDEPGRPRGGPGGPGGGAPVPEPTTMFLVGSGLAGAALYRRRRQRANRQP